MKRKIVELMGVPVDEIEVELELALTKLEAMQEVAEEMKINLERFRCQLNKLN